MKSPLLRLMACASGIYFSGAALAVTSADYSSFPPSNSDANAPLVMLVMSHDHSLYMKAYNDYSDIDGDGQIDTTYNDSFSYYGYFNSSWCYAQSSGVFVPKKPAAGSNGHECPDVTGTGPAPWSGNFLNWAAMTRMDVVRKVLFGGKRRTDPTSTGGQGVVLERAILPPDIHSFAKVYRGADMSKFTPYTYNASTLPAITLCNTTTAANGLSQNVDTLSYPPLLRVAKGIWPDWAASDAPKANNSVERQCAWGGDLRPAASEELATLSVLVEACVSGQGAESNSQCRKYPNDNIKPIGLLQEYGENKRMRFGLLTGSFSKARSGGALRRNIGFVVNNADTSQDEIDLATGAFVNQGLNAGLIYPGVISTLSRMRISRYEYGKNTYADCSASGIGSSTFNNPTGPDNNSVACRDWGNPVAEIYAEALRYFSNAGAAVASFNSDDRNHINGLGPVGWVDAQPADEHCAECAIIVLSTGSSNFDGFQQTITTSAGSEDAFPGGITGIDYTGLRTRLQAIGVSEGINGDYFIGSNGTSDPADGRCTVKTITPANLFDVRGLCPEAPNMEGSFHLAGLAYHANGTDLRTDRDGKQNVSTWAVQLAELLPTFEVKVGSNIVRFVPYCRAQGASVTDRQCAMINIEIIDDLQGDTGELYITWEDSSWGSDYDLDGKQQIKYCIGLACDDPLTAVNEGIGNGSIRFTTDIVHASKQTETLNFGYIISGTRSDGAYLDIWTQGNQGPTTSLSDAPAPASRDFVPGMSGAGFLENPLWYAAKYGSFNDIDGDGTPLHNGDPANKIEWDVKDSDGNLVAGGDGFPDSYYQVKNPARLEDRMRAILQSLTSAVQSNTSAAVIATTGRGVGAIYQAIYYPTFKLESTFGDEIDSILWAGALNALFIDDRGRLREDKGVKYKLESSSIDYPINIYFDDDVNKTLVQRLDDDNNFVGLPYELKQLAPIWSAHHELSALTESQTVNQRNYSADAGTGRYIITWIDRDLDRVVDETLADDNEIVALTATNFGAPAASPSVNGNNFRWLGLTDANAELGSYFVNYIRGIDYSEGDIVLDGANFLTRSREIDMDGDGVDEIWRLGDIIHSSPAVVASPANPEFTGNSYKLFRQHYASRRQVVYIGANDGMLHAFNGGFFDSAEQKFLGGGDIDGDGIVDYDNHRIGAELWAYVPGNLLPHLRWLVEPDYPHVYYVDGTVQTFDAQIFADDADHPGGWGTVLVVGMRLGGGAVTLDLKQDTNGDGIGDTDAQVSTGSAYVVMDVTNPEVPPKLIAELSPAEVGFTMSNPTVVRRQVASENDWVLVFGNGPNVLQSATSTRDSKLFAYDLVNRTPITINAALQTAVGEANSALGSFAKVDWKTAAGDDGRDEIDDAIFVGTTGGSPTAPTGVLKKIVLDSSASNLGFSSSATAFTAAAVSRPVTAAPILTRDIRDSANIKEWISFGTGRFEVVEDTDSTAEQAYYGILNPISATDINLTAEGIVDITEVLVSANSVNNIRNRDGSDVSYTRDGTTRIFYRYKDLQDFITAEGGWLRRFGTGAGGFGAERNITDSTHFGTNLLFTTYMPETDSCEIGGLGFLYAINAFTGLPPIPAGVLGSGLHDGADYELARVGLGNTLPSEPVIHNSAGGGSKAIVQGSRGEFMLTDLIGGGTLSGRESWREVRGIEFLLTK